MKTPPEGPKGRSQDISPPPGLPDQPDDHPPGPPDRPLFLSHNDAQSSPYIDGYSGGPDQPADFTQCDENEPLPDPGNPVLKPRHREIARLHALGWTNNQICEKLGYSQSRVSILLHTPEIRREVDRYRNRLYERDLAAAMKDLGHDAVQVLEAMLRSPEQKLKDRTEAAKWLLEKLTGKPKQEVSVESQTLNRFLEVLDQMRETGENPDELPVLDVTPSDTSGPAGPSDAAAGPEQVAESPSRDVARLAENLFD